MSGSAPGEAYADFIFLMRHGKHTNGRLTQSALADTGNVTRHLADGRDRGQRPERAQVAQHGAQAAVAALVGISVNSGPARR